MRSFAAALIVAATSLAGTIDPGSVGRAWDAEVRDDVGNVDFAGLTGQTQSGTPQRIVAPAAMIAFGKGAAPVLCVIGGEDEFVRINPTTEESPAEPTQIPHAPEPGVTALVGTAFVLMSLVGRKRLHGRRVRVAGGFAESDAASSIGCMPEVEVVES
jgi:hypothetical protein